MSEPAEKNPVELFEDVVYEWVVNPKNYTGHRYALLLRSFPVEEMHSLLSEEGEDVDAFINEHAPLVQASDGY
jgi:hypothetical protein